MNSQQLTIRDIFLAAREIRPGPERLGYLCRACGEDLALLREVEALLRADESAGSFLALPAGEAEPDGSELGSDGTRASGTPSALTESASETIGRYKLLEPIGEGGFGVVYMAEQREPVKRRVALKIIKLGMDTRQVIARFEAERQALAMMDHPNIAKVLDAGSTETGRPYFVMEYIKGVPILEHCDTERLDTEARLELFTRVCHAVQHAHQKGIIHRDIKPSNVLITMHDGVPVPKVIDFGIAKATSAELTTRTLFTEHRQMIGTPAYMSPEQAEMSGLDIDTRSDIYSLGVLLYELLTGTTPFDAQELTSKGYVEMLRIIREVEPHKPSTRLSSLGRTGAALQRHAADMSKLSQILRGDLDWIVMRCLEKDRARRYETANGLAADIQRHLRDEPVTAGPPGAGYKLRKFVKRNRAQVIAGGVVAGALVLGVVGTSMGLVWALSEKNRANAEAAKAIAAAASEAAARVSAQENEQKAVAAAKVAEESSEAEAKARKRAETISKFVSAALNAGDPLNAGKPGTEAAGRDMTILAAMDNAIRDIDSGRFKDDPETEAALRGTIGVILFNNGQYAKARPLLEQALAVRERLLTGDQLVVAKTLHELSKVYASQGQFTEAEPLAKRVLAIREEALGPDHPDVAKVLSHLAAIYRARGQYALAEPLTTRALEIREKALGPEHPEVARGVGDLGMHYMSQGRYAEAEPLLKRSLAIHEKALGPEHPDVANSLNLLGTLYHAQRRFADAEPLFTRALAIREKALGPEHPDVARSLNNLAMLYVGQGQYARAEPLNTRALAIREKALGPDHPGVAETLNSMASVYKAQGRYAEAEPLFERSLDIKERTFGPKHPDVAQCLNNLAENCSAQGRYAEAQSLHERALAIREEVLGPDHPSVAESMNNLGLLHDVQGRHADAEPILARALAIRQKALADHPDVAMSLSHLARTRQALGRAAEARQGFDEAVAMLRRIAPNGSLAFARVLSMSASARLHSGDAAAALPEFEESAAMAEQLLPPEHPQLKEYRDELAKCAALLADPSGPAGIGGDR